jgi:dipeptidyl aminopeptidase/acylaminoacyl peptidase
MRRALLVAALSLAGGQIPLTAQDATHRPITLEDLRRLREVTDPQLSPDGQWVAFTVREASLATDDHPADLWLASWDGRTRTRLTRTPAESEEHPRWSPDGRRIAFLSSRGGGGTANGVEREGAQLWIMELGGGEAERVTGIAGGIEDFAWSPDGRRFVLVIEDGDSVEAGATDSTWRRTARPIVLDRFQFKQDYAGYLGRRRKHLYLFDLSSRTLEPLTPGRFDEVMPAWSPDGQYLTFVSKRGDDPDRHDNYDLYVIQAAGGAVPRQLTTFSGPDSHPDWESPPAWSPTGRAIAYLQGGPDSLIYYATRQAATIDWSGGTPRLLAPTLDRNIDRPAWARDGRSLFGIEEDDRTRQLVRFPAAGGRPETIVGGRRVVSDYSLAAGGRVAVLAASPDRPAEIFAVEGPELRNLSRQNDSLLATLRLAPPEEISVRSKDGTTVNGFLVRPVGADSGRSYPAVLRIHGGPVQQFENTFDFLWQLLAANGYAVVAMNPRGSSGRGQAYAMGIWADWGNRDVQDVLAGVDYAIRIGLADPDRLGVGGSSYGGMLTNYVIARDQRFRAAVSGASISNIFAGFGTDMYVREYLAELGPPWRNPEAYQRMSFPFLHADRIRTPTLFMCGEKDFNVPLLNSEQMYQALRTLGVPTQLVIYPDQFHGLSSVRYDADRYQRYLDWYREYLKP